MSDTTALQLKARIIGVLWLGVVIGLQVAGEVATRPVYSANGGEALVAALAQSESALRWGAVGILLSGLAYIVVTGLLWEILRPVGKTTAMVAALFGIAGGTLWIPTALAKLVPLLLFQGASAGGATAANASAYAFASLDMVRHLFMSGWVLFGCQCVLNGWLIARSSFLPRGLGVMLAIGGFTYAAVPLLYFGSPNIGRPLIPIMMGLALLGEGALSTWLIAKGLDTQAWQRAGLAMSPSEHGSRDRAE